jgi:hypothetical protein
VHKDTRLLFFLLILLTNGTKSTRMASGVGYSSFGIRCYFLFIGGFRLYNV